MANKIKMLVKRVQWQEVEISTENGFDVPEDINELFEFCHSIKNDPLSVCEDDFWSAPDSDDVTIESFVIEQK